MKKRAEYIVGIDYSGSHTVKVIASDADEALELAQEEVRELGNPGVRLDFDMPILSLDMEGLIERWGAEDADARYHMEEDK